MTRRVLGLARDFLAGLASAVLVQPVRTGTFALARHEPGIAACTLVVGALFAVALGAILLAEPLRVAAEIIVVDEPTRRRAIPAALAPGVLLLVGFATAILLAGAQRCRWWLRILSLASSMLILGVLVQTAAGRDRGPALILAIAGLVATAAVCAWSWLHAPPLAVQAVVLVFTVQACIIGSYRCWVVGGQGIDFPYEVANTGLMLGWFILLASPLAFLGGLKTVAFGVLMCTWSADFVRGRVPTRGAVIVTLILLGCAAAVAFNSVRGDLELAGTTGDPADLVWLLQVHLLAAALNLVAVGSWFLVQRIATPSRRGGTDLGREGTDGDDEGPGHAVPASVVDQATRTIALPTSIAFLSSALIAVPILLVRLLLLDLVPVSLVLDAAVDHLRADWVVVATRTLACVGIGVACVWLARSGRPVMAGIAALSTIMLTAFVLVQPGAPLDTWVISVDAMGNLGAMFAIILVAVFAGRGGLTPARLQVILLIALLSMLVRQADFFTVPLSFLATLAGSAFLIFGLVWGFLTDGASAHEDSPGYPRDGRMLVFLGQALFGISVVAWAVIGRDPQDWQALAEFASISVQTLGTALILAASCYGWRALGVGSDRADQGDQEVQAVPRHGAHPV